MSLPVEEEAGAGFAVDQIYDAVVVGLGAVGSAALYRLAASGASTLGIDRYAPPHALGSSHCDSRITRQAIGEGLAYVPLVLRSNLIWETLEAETGQRLLNRCGFLYLTRDDPGTRHHGKAGFLERTAAAAQAFGIAHERLDSSAVRARFPQFSGLMGDEIAYYEPGGGYLRPETCIAACLAEARRLGAHIAVDTRVQALEGRAGGVDVCLGGARVRARKVILAAGSWMGDFLDPPLAGLIAVHRQVLHWFSLEDARTYEPRSSPTFIWTHGSDAGDQFYGFPPIDGEVKVAREDYDSPFDPDTDDRSADAGHAAFVAEHHVRGRLAGLSALPVRSRVCHYAVTPDSDFLIDQLSRDVMFASSCSGHGFKHAAAVGEALADWALERPPLVDLSPFSARRFGTLRGVST